MKILLGLLMALQMCITLFVNNAFAENMPDVWLKHAQAVAVDYDSFKYTNVVPGHENHKVVAFMSRWYANSRNRIHQHTDNYMVACIDCNQEATFAKSRVQYNREVEAYKYDTLKWESPVPEAANEAIMNKVKEWDVSYGANWNSNAKPAAQVGIPALCALFGLNYNTL